MRELLTNREFSDYCMDKNYTKYLFDSCNQKNMGFDTPCNIRQIYTDMKISFNPNEIYFSYGRNYLCLNRVKYITVDENSVLGTVFTIHCKSYGNDAEIKEYTIVAG